MNANEASRVVDAAIDAAFPRQRDERLTDFISVRIDEDPSDAGVLQVFIHSPASLRMAIMQLVQRTLLGQTIHFL